MWVAAFNDTDEFIGLYNLDQIEGIAWSEIDLTYIINSVIGQETCAYFKTVEDIDSLKVYLPNIIVGGA